VTTLTFKLFFLDNKTYLECSLLSRLTKASDIIWLLQILSVFGMWAGFIGVVKQISFVELSQVKNFKLLPIV